MICEQLWNPKSIVVVGASNNIEKPGGKVLYNIINGNYQGVLHCVNPKEDKIQGITSYSTVEDIPDTELAIIAVSCDHTVEIVNVLANRKKTKAFIIISAGFSEEGLHGAELEKKIIDIVNSVNGTLIGPNCTGVLTPHYHGIFTEPIPKLNSNGCDFITGSGATACFILELGIPRGLTFSRVIAVGNSAQTGVEEILESMDESFNPKTDSKVKILYIENISKPGKLLKHALSLRQKGCRIAAIKAGSSEAGSRAASSHTGALASSDLAVETLFKKAGIIRCNGRDELINAASVLMYSELKGKNIAIITHAGGPGVMLTDALSKSGFHVPFLNSSKSKELLSKLLPGSSSSNPIDFLATGTAEHLGTIIDYCENEFDEIDGIAVIFGTPGLTKIYKPYEMLDKKMRTCKKPIYPVMPSILTAEAETKSFIAKGWVILQDETNLGNALAKVYNTAPSPTGEIIKCKDISKLKGIVHSASNGYLPAEKVSEFLDAVGIERVNEFYVNSADKLDTVLTKIKFPIVMKVIGPVHKSDSGGVILGIKTKEEAFSSFKTLSKIEGYMGVLIQPMISGTELFIGVSKEGKFGHIILFGLGGIFIELIRDFSTCMPPVSKNEILDKLKKLKSYKLFTGIRGKQPINENIFAEIICRLSDALYDLPEISEMDINPLLADGDSITAVDARIKIIKYTHTL